ncbi:iron ABC transporter solute-binding lipoprotein [Clostridium baratii]|nr:hypothetical protein [Clostridium baratii]CUP51812.1 iron ABC transporter solute-binding lipoprotein [Clostridium baratii]
MWDVEANGLVKKDNIKDEAKEFLDWAISDSAMKEYQVNYPLVTVDNNYKIPDDYPANVKDLLVNMDFEHIGKEKDKVTDEWNKRYDSKSEKK